MKLERLNQMMSKILFTITVNGYQHQENLQKPYLFLKNPKLFFFDCAIYECTLNAEKNSAPLSFVWY